MARIHDSTPIEELAMEYVVLVEGASLTDDIFDDSHDLMERMIGRLGQENIDALIERSLKAYRLLNPPTNLNIKWYTGIAIAGHPGKKNP